MRKKITFSFGNFKTSSSSLSNRLVEIKGVFSATCTFASSSGASFLDCLEHAGEHTGVLVMPNFSSTTCNRARISSMFLIRWNVETVYEFLRVENACMLRVEMHSTSKKIRKKLHTYMWFSILLETPEILTETKVLY